MEELVRLHVLAREVNVGIVFLWEETPRAKHHGREPTLFVNHTTELLRGVLGDTINVPRLDRPGGLVEPRRFVARFLSNRAPNHERRGGRKHETIVLGGDRRLEQIQRPGDVHVDERLRGIPRDVRLVKRARVHDRLHAMVREDRKDRRAIGDRSDHVRLRATRHVEADHRVARFAEHGGKVTPEPAGRPREQDAHARRLA